MPDPDHDFIPGQYSTEHCQTCGLLHADRFVWLAVELNVTSRLHAVPRSALPAGFRLYLAESLVPLCRRRPLHLFDFDREGPVLKRCAYCLRKFGTGVLVAVEVWRWVWNQSRSTKSARLVLLAVADCCNAADGTGAWPSMAELCRKTALSERAVQTALAALVRLGELRVDRNGGPGGVNRYRVVMTPAESAPPQGMHPAGNAGVQKGESPQATTKDPAGNAPPADSAPPQGMRGTPADSAPGTTNEPPKNSSSKSSKPRKRGTRIPDDFAVTPDMVAWARERVPHVDGKTETEKFVNYWRAKTKDATKLDWVATWRNWMLNAADRYPGRAVTVRKATTDQRMDQAEAALAEVLAEAERRSA